MRAIEDWWFSTFFSRLTYRSDGAKPCCILLMTRWSSKDIISKILKSDNSHEWKYINYPALDENDNALWEEMQPKELLLNIRANSPAIFQALYQGQPGEDVASEFNLNNFLIYPIEHQFHKSPKFYFASWDTAAKISDKNDYTVGTLWSFHQNKIYLEDYIKGRYEFPELERLIKEKNKAWNTKYCLVEDASSGTGVLQSLKASQKEIKYIGIPANVKKKLPVIIPRLEDHSVVLKNYEEIISELKDYPGGENDDAVSSLVNAVWYFALNWRKEDTVSLAPKTVIKSRKQLKIN
jgi:predicted phage terminase large subunit-like protein